MNDALRARATELGVQTDYHDVTGVLHQADGAVLEQVVAVLEADRAASTSARRIAAAIHRSDAGPVTASSAVSEATIDLFGHPTALQVRHGDDSDTIQLPADLPVGCHVLQFESAAGPGETVVVVAPATMPRDEHRAGQACLFAPTYALWERAQPLPSFRHLHEFARAALAAGIGVVATLPLYEMYLDEPYDPSPYAPVSRLHWSELYLDDDLLPSAPVVELGELVEWRALAERRRHQLVEAASTLDSARLDEITSFATSHPDIAAYARFRASRDAGGDLVVEHSYLLAQYLADEQLGAIRRDPDAAALALDLPIGSHPLGYEVWADPAMFASQMNVGAPPDTFFAEGQNWGFPPPLPGAMRASGHRPWRQLISRVGRHADILRIDHAMAVHRLWWVPDGFSAEHGVYVHYPREEILAVIAASAAATGLTIVGEDLGTVPTEVSDAFDHWDMLGMYEEQFHIDDDPLPRIPARTVAGIRTHDMEPLASLVATRDTSGYRHRIGDAHGRAVPARWDAVVEEMLVRLCASDAYLVQADLDDLIGETRPHNLPGRVIDGLWARRLAAPTSATLADPDIGRRLSILGRTTS